MHHFGDMVQCSGMISHAVCYEPLILTLFVYFPRVLFSVKNIEAHQFQTSL
jgi:hypothetical protein